ncbi:MAG: hypothetical protein IRZ03_08480 [Acidobacterium ailaaui]|nr:hypothetical protein [Pseudacidobacterium ailaaui]
MTARGAITRGRRAAEALMVDQCTIRAESDEVTTDPVTGVVTPVPGKVVYTGRCKLQLTRGAFPSTPEGGEHRWSMAPLEVHIPVSGTSAVNANCVIEVTASSDPANVGRRFRVRAGDRKTFGTSIRLIVDEVIH